jgi:hypothetical protein
MPLEINGDNFGKPIPLCGVGDFYETSYEVLVRIEVVVLL